MDKNELEHAEPAEPTSNNAIDQMVLDEEDSPSFLNVSDAGVPVGLAAYEERLSIPAEEQNAGRVVDSFYRMEFHITPRFFSDSNRAYPKYEV